jgi:hypothetical protein
MATMVEHYLAERGGSVESYHRGLTAGQRIPQAFFNALCEDDQQRLRGTDKDPFFKDGQGPVYDAIQWLLDTEDR